MSPEERKELSRRLVASRRGNHTNGQKPGKPRDLTNAQWAEVQKQADVEARRIMKKMKEAEQLPDDKRAEEALEKAVVTLRSASSPKDVAALGRLVLDFTRAKPAQKIDHTVRTHEDFLDELAEHQPE